MRPAVIPIQVHASQFPEAVQATLLSSLRSRQINHKFHYATYKQARQWLDLFGKFSPFTNDRDCRRIYEQSIEHAITCSKRREEVADPNPLNLIGLGCGSGEKELKILEAFRAAGKEMHFTPIDVSMPLVVSAASKARNAGFVVTPGIVCDFVEAEDLPNILEPSAAGGTRLFTFFGMLPNFEPDVAFATLAAFLAPGDYLLISANLAPGPDGMHKILPQYENSETAEWLLTFLFDLGVERSDGHLRWSIETDPRSAELQRFSASFEFLRDRTIRVENEEFSFAAGEKLRLFFSYRYSVDIAKRLLGQHGVIVDNRWITSSAEEAVFLCRKT